jgi:hypothetical protein
MLRKTKEYDSLTLKIKTIASRFTAVVIVGSLLVMPYITNTYFALYDLKTETQEITKTSIWSATTKTIDLYLRPFDESVIKQQYYDRPLITKIFLNTIIKDIDFELQNNQEAYIVYSESTIQILDKSYIIFPFHYFW